MTSPILSPRPPVLPVVFVAPGSPPLLAAAGDRGGRGALGGAPARHRGGPPAPPDLRLLRIPRAVLSAPLPGARRAGARTPDPRPARRGPDPVHRRTRAWSRSRHLHS